MYKQKANKVYWFMYGYDGAYENIRNGHKRKCLYKQTMRKNE